MDFAYQAVDYNREHFLDTTLPSFPKRSGVYKIFDRRGKLIVLDKSSNLHDRMERFFGERSEMLRDLDLREITSRIEFRQTDSSFETLYLLYRERRTCFPKAYRKMRTFRFFTLMKINRKQRFPRIYKTRQVKAGVDYFGPFVTRGQFARLKTALERTFKLRPCLYNIRGNDPHPDCLYFQMHACSKPCNNDIDRSGYLQDVQNAMDFVQGRDREIEERLLAEMNTLAGETKFEAAEVVRRKLDKIRKARDELKDTFHSVSSLNAIVLLPTDSVTRCKIAFVREGMIAGFMEYDVSTLAETLPPDVDRFFNNTLESEAREWQYDEFCLVSNFIVDPLQSVDVLLMSHTDDISQRVIERLQQKKESENKTMLILSREDVKQVLDIPELFEGLKAGFRMLAAGQWQVPLRTAIDMSRQEGIALFMPAYCEGLSTTGMKLVTIMSRNPEKNLPLIHSNYLHVSAETGEIKCLMDAEVLTGMRTATTSALVADLVGKSGGRVLAMFGTGVQAWFHVEVFTKLFSIGEVLVYGLTPELAEEFAGRIERRLRTPARRAVMSELKRADLICTCTTNSDPMFEYKDVRPGAHITGMGSYRPHTRELGTDVIKNSLVIVDSYEGALNEAGDIVIPIKEGAITREHLYASIDELVSETKSVPDDPTKTTLFKSLGMALEDLVAADLAYRKAVEKGIGTEVKL